MRSPAALQQLSAHTRARPSRRTPPPRTGHHVRDDTCRTGRFLSGSGVDFLLDSDVEPEALRAALAQALSVEPDQVDVIADLSDIREAPVIAQVGELDGAFPSSVAVYARHEIGVEFVQAV